MSRDLGRRGELNDHEGDLATEPTWRIAPIRSRLQDGIGGEYTHICLDKQLPCLYPFPQRSQRSSAKARFPSPLTKCDPSLARRFRLLVLTGLLSELLSSPPAAATEEAPLLE
jgi:hypothetical protein